jgi:hypothetical protein
MPRRLFGAFLDLTTFRDRDGTLAQALVNGGKREVTTGLYDFQDPREINFSQLGEANPDLWIPYATLLGKVNEISNALTSPEPKALPEENIIRALTGLRKNPSLRAIYTDEDLNFACVLAILGGPMQGVPQTLADQPGSDVDYNNLVESVLSDPRLYEGMAGNRKEIKERFRQRLIAEDPTKVALLQIGPTRRDNVKRQSRLGQ